MTTAASDATSKSQWWNSLHIMQGLLPFDRSHLGPDIVAGITLAALGIPEVMGYTKIIGTPVITGLYTLFLPVLAFAILGSSRHLVVSADSATAAMVAAALSTLAIPANSPRYFELTSVIALVSGGILLLARILRLGFVADFLSRTVLVGFLSGVGVQVAVGQLHEMLGIEKGPHGFFRGLLFTFQHIGETRLPSLYIALAVIAIIVGFEMFAPRFPGGLVAVIGMMSASAFLHWDDHGVQIVGPVPNGMPRLGFPHLTFSDLNLVLPISFSCFIVILAQSAATSRAYAVRYRDQFNENSDLVGLAFANAMAACSNTFVVNGSPTKTAMVDTAGGRSQWSHVTTAIVVLIVLLFLTRPLSFLPNSVLAAIVFLIGVNLVDHRGLANIRRVAPGEFILALVTAATVVIFGVEQGIILAMVLSLLMHVRHGYRPYTGVVVRDTHNQWRLEDPVPGKIVEPGLVMFWFGAGLFYANVSHFIEVARRLVDECPPPVRWLVIDATAITELDFSAGRALIELHQDLSNSGIELALIVVQVRHQGHIERLGLLDLIGAHRIFESREACIESYRSAVASKSVVGTN